MLTASYGRVRVSLILARRETAAAPRHAASLPRAISPDGATCRLLRNLACRPVATIIPASPPAADAGLCTYTDPTRPPVGSFTRRSDLRRTRVAGARRTR